MKILHRKNSRHNERGMVTVVFITLLAIMLLLVMANCKSLFYLHREIKLLEQKQIKQLNTVQTNAVIVAQSPKPGTK